MNITEALAELKARPDFAQHVGMTLIHNGTVRAWSRQDRRVVSAIEVTPDLAHIERLRQEFLQKDGIYDIIIDAKNGILKPGDDLLYIIVAGDIREHVTPVLAALLDRIKSEAVIKREVISPT